MSNEKREPTLSSEPPLSPAELIRKECVRSGINLRGSDTLKLLLQEVDRTDSGGEHAESAYLAYLAPPSDPSSDGHFVREDGNVCWYSALYPDGISCEAVCIPKTTGDAYLEGRQNDGPSYNR